MDNSSASEVVKEAKLCQLYWTWLHDLPVRIFFNSPQGV
jgi:hypothetical protein